MLRVEEDPVTGMAVAQVKPPPQVVGQEKPQAIRCTLLGSTIKVQIIDYPTARLLLTPQD
ncbi:hypothetical protein [Pantoea sp. AS142]|uniref:hypothetical protein n=1 Tax=Pantoea sp. AS142 TaxID=3081292 RepID=UPI0030179E82